MKKKTDAENEKEKEEKWESEKETGVREKNLIQVVFLLMLIHSYNPVYALFISRSFLMSCLVQINRFSSFLCVKVPSLHRTPVYRRWAAKCSRKDKNEIRFRWKTKVCATAPYWNLLDDSWFLLNKHLQCRVWLSKPCSYDCDASTLKSGPLRLHISCISLINISIRCIVRNFR